MKRLTKSHWTVEAFNAIGAIYMLGWFVLLILMFFNFPESEWQLYSYIGILMGTAIAGLLNFAIARGLDLLGEMAQTNRYLLDVASGNMQDDE